MIHSKPRATCPRCKSGNYFDAYYDRIRKESRYCYDCGYERQLWFKRNENGKFIKMDEKKELSWNNLIPEEILIENPFGAYKIKNKNGDGQMGNLETRHAYDEFVSKIARNTNMKHDIKSATVSRFMDGGIVQEVIYQNK